MLAGDTNVEATGCSIKDVESDPKNINDWLTENKLALILEKTIQLNIKTLKINPRFDLNNQNVKVDNTYKYLGIRLDSKLIFKTHISHVKYLASSVELLKYYVPRSKLLNFYKTYVNSIIRYGILF